MDPEGRLQAYQPFGWLLAILQDLRLLGEANNARHYGQLCLEVSQTDKILPFYLGYAYEALARAEQVAGNQEKKESYLEAAHQAAEKVPDIEAQEMLLNDLASI